MHRLLPQASACFELALQGPVLCLPPFLAQLAPGLVVPGFACHPSLLSQSQGGAFCTLAPELWNVPLTSMLVHASSWTLVSILEVGMVVSTLSEAPRTG